MGVKRSITEFKENKLQDAWNWLPDAWHFSWTHETNFYTERMTIVKFSLNCCVIENNNSKLFSNLYRAYLRIQSPICIFSLFFLFPVSIESNIEAVSQSLHCKDIVLILTLIANIATYMCLICAVSKINSIVFTGF